jgi:hypothetical protein
VSVTDRMIPERIAIIVDVGLPIGLLANAVAVVSLSIGDLSTGVLGSDVVDAGGRLHSGITALNIPILGASAARLFDIVEEAREEANLLTVGFSAIAQSSRDYADYTSRTGALHPEEITYVGLGLAGTSRSIRRLTGSLPLIR